MNILTTPIAKVATLQNTDRPQPVVPVIPKPKGISYSLRKKMGLEDDPVKYDEIKVRCHPPFLPPPALTTRSSPLGRN